MTEYKSFETPRLTLKPTSIEDAAFVLELFNSPKWLRYIGDRNVHSIEDAKAYISAKIYPQLQRLGYANYTVIRKSDGIKMGSCGLYDREGLEGIDIGFAFLPDFEGQGFAFEAARKVLDFADDVFGIERIRAITTHDNSASQKLLEKLGLTFKKNIKLPNDEEELLMYEITLVK